MSAGEADGRRLEQSAPLFSRREPVRQIKFSLNLLVNTLTRFSFAVPL